MLFVQAGIMHPEPGKETEEPGSLLVLQFEHIMFPLIILSLGCFVAFLVFLGEIWLGKTKKQAEQQEFPVADQFEEEINKIEGLVDTESASITIGKPANIIEDNRKF